MTNSSEQPLPDGRGSVCGSVLLTEPRPLGSGCLAHCVVVWCLLSAGVLRGADLQLFEAVQPHMGTLVRIQLYAADAGRANEGFRAAFLRIAQLDAALSDYRDDSEVNRLCRSAVGRPVKVSDDLFRVLAAARQLAEETDGAFDVTIGPVTVLWRQARREHRLPAPDALREALQHSGYRNLHLDATARTVTLDQEGMRLDLGGIGKGYAADAALAALAELGIQRALVAASGDLAIGDPPPGRSGWSIGIDSYSLSAGSFARVLVLCNAAVSSSGDREQNLDIDGVRYSHIVDPATGMGLTRPLAVAVVARHGIDADSWSTALSVLGPERGIALIEKHQGLSALVTKTSGEAVESSGWPRAGSHN
jgi:FAD:protein FMN transferase